MKLTIDEVEDTINEVLAARPKPDILPVIDSNGAKVGEGFKGVDFYSVFNREDYPELFDSLRGRIISLIRGTHVRIFETLEDALNFGKGLSSPVKIINGPPLEDMTPGELENG